MFYVTYIQNAFGGAAVLSGHTREDWAQDQADNWNTAHPYCRTCVLALSYEQAAALVDITASRHDWGWWVVEQARERLGLMGE